MWHWIGCIYWLISSIEGFGKVNEWTPDIKYEFAPKLEVSLLFFCLQFSVFVIIIVCY